MPGMQRRNYRRNVPFVRKIPVIVPQTNSSDETRRMSVASFGDFDVHELNDTMALREDVHLRGFQIVHRCGDLD